MKCGANLSTSEKSDDRKKLSRCKAAKIEKTKEARGTARSDGSSTARRTAHLKAALLCPPSFATLRETCASRFRRARSKKSSPSRPAFSRRRSTESGLSGPTEAIIAAASHKPMNRWPTPDSSSNACGASSACGFGSDCADARDFERKACLRLPALARSTRLGPA